MKICSKLGFQLVQKEPPSIQILAPLLAPPDSEPLRGSERQIWYLLGFPPSCHCSHFFFFAQLNKSSSPTITFQPLILLKFLNSIFSPIVNILSCIPSIMFVHSLRWERKGCIISYGLPAMFYQNSVNLLTNKHKQENISSC